MAVSDNLKFSLPTLTLLYVCMQHYIESVRQMAHCQLVAGSPLRTLCLLTAGQPADVFSADSTSKSGGSPDALHMSQQHAQVDIFSRLVSTELGF